MARFKTHYRQSAGFPVWRIGALALIFVLGLFAWQKYARRQLVIPPFPGAEERFFLPNDSLSQIIHLPYHSRSASGNWLAMEYRPAWAHFQDSLIGEEGYLKIVRAAAQKHGSVFLTYGPRLPFMALMQLESGEWQGLGLLGSEASPVSIDSLEILTGLDFFAELVNDSTEQVLETQVSPERW